MKDDKWGGNDLLIKKSFSITLKNMKVARVIYSTCNREDSLVKTSPDPFKVNTNISQGIGESCEILIILLWHRTILDRSQEKNSTYI